MVTLHHEPPKANQGTASSAVSDLMHGVLSFLPLHVQLILQLARHPLPR